MEDSNGPNISATAGVSASNDNMLVEDNSTPMVKTDINTPDPSSSSLETSDVDKITPEAGNKEKIDYGRIYDPIIAEWKSAYENVIDEDKPYSEDALSFSFYDMDNIHSISAYYALYDIDGNGIMELILRKESSFEDIISYIFSINNGKAVNIFGYDDSGIPIEVPWSRVGASDVLSNGLIDCIAGDYAIYRITDDGCHVTKIASSDPYDYPDEASLADAKWNFYINNSCFAPRPAA